MAKPNIVKYIFFQERKDQIDIIVNQWLDDFVEIEIISTNMVESTDGNGSIWISLSIFYKV